jgi:diketogulonate reductase-like aldo/keto reductase
MVKLNRSVAMPSGTLLPLNGYGTWKAEAGHCAKGLRAALEVGYRHIDLAAVYMNEPELGLVFEEYCGGANPKIPREQLFITSKVWNTCHARQHVMDAIKQSLSDLRLTYLDLYLIHHPFAWEYTGMSFAHGLTLSFVFLSFWCTCPSLEMSPGIFAPPIASSLLFFAKHTRTDSRY